MSSVFMSIVSPVYRAENIVPELVRRIQESTSKITEDYEIILVCDGSPDNSWDAIKAECKKDKRVKGINLSRNFGQHYAITAGMQYVQGEWIVLMDCDLQDRPEEIPNLYAKAQEGYDIVLARRVNRRDGFFKIAMSKSFHAVFDWLSGMKTDSAISNLSIYKRSVIDTINKMPEMSRSFDSLVAYVGFNKAILDCDHSERYEGESSYTLRKALKLAFDIIISNSNKPLRIITGFGFCFSLIAFILAIYNVIANLLGLITVEGYTTTVFSVWFVGGFILMVLGVLGLYIGKIFDQVKGRPLYIVQEEVNVE